MSFLSLLTAARPEIEAELLRALKDLRAENASRFPLDTWLIDEAVRRVNLGKLLRGSLALGVWSAYGGSDRRTAVQAAAAVELYGTGILMQDDVTDRSGTRRGLPTIHVIAQEKAQELQLDDSVHFGENCGTYLGDILYFTAHGLLANLELPVQKLQAINALCARELWMLGFAQLEDIRLSKLPPSDRTVTQDHILSMLAGKTGRYSVAWPLCTGALLADAPPSELEQLAKIGESIGVLYQLRDDELGVFGDPAVTGKSVDDDIREGKKTLYWLSLVAQLEPQDPLWRTFANPEATVQEIESVRQFLRSSGIEKARHNELIARQSELAQELKDVSLPPAVISLLEQLLTFVVDREK